jgi:hypothetical protein
MASQLQPIAYIAPSDSQILESDEVVSSGDGGQGTPIVSIQQDNAMVIVASPYVT